MEGDLLRLHLAVLDLHLVPAQHDRDVLADPRQVPVPVRYILVGDARRHVEHDDRALALNVVAIAQAAVLLLPGRVPDVESQRAEVRVEVQRVHLYAQRRHVLLLELPGEVALHERRLADAAVTHQDQLELRVSRLGHCQNVQKKTCTSHQWSEI